MNTLLNLAAGAAFFGVCSVAAPVIGVSAAVVGVGWAVVPLAVGLGLTARALGSDNQDEED